MPANIRETHLCDVYELIYCLRETGPSSPTRTPSYLIVSRELHGHYTTEMAASHFLQVQVKSQVISLQVQVKSQVIWSDVKSSHKSFSQTSSQVTSHLVQTQVKSQVSLSKYKSSRTLFCPAVIRNQGQSSNQSTVSYSQRYMKWSIVLSNLMYKYGVPYMYTH